MKMLKKMKNKKGFTLIELIVVIAVIAILAAIMLPRFLGFSDSAKEKAVLSDARNISVGVQAIIAEDGKILVGTVTGPAAGTGGAEEALNYIGKTLTAGQTLTITTTAGNFTYIDTARNYTVNFDGSTGAFTVPAKIVTP